MNKDIDILTNIIQRRRSIFPVSYTSRPIPQELIRQILENANYAPTHKLTQPWRFTVFTGDAKTKLGRELARLYRETTPAEKFLQKKHDSIVEKIGQSACVIAIKAQLHPGLLPEWEELAALACAMQNVALTAEALQIGAYWSSPEMIHHLSGFLELEENEKCYGLFYMGYHNEAPRAAARKPMDDKIKWLG